MYYYPQSLINCQNADEYEELINFGLANGLNLITLLMRIILITMDQISILNFGFNIVHAMVDGSDSIIMNPYIAPVYFLKTDNQ